MPLNSETLLLLLFVVVIVAFGIAMFAVGLIVKGEFHQQPKKAPRENPKEKKKPSAPPPKKTKSGDPCINKDKNYYFGFLHKDLDDKTPVPAECLPCDFKLECLQGKSLTE